MRLDVWGVVLNVAAVEGEVVFEHISSNRGEVNPDLAVIIAVDSVSEVDFVGVLEDTI